MATLKAILTPEAYLEKIRPLRAPEEEVVRGTTEQEDRC